MDIKDFSNAFEKIGKQWMLVAAQKDGQANAMTASWGGVGVMWNKNVAFVFVRPQRYTKEFIDSSSYLSLSFFDEDYRPMLNFMGTKSGRDVDKIKHENLTLVEGEKAPLFKQAKTTLICKKLYVQEMKKECFLDQKIVDTFFKAEDFHYMYVVEIEKII